MLQPIEALNGLLIIDDTGSPFLRDTRIGLNKDNFIIDFMEKEKKSIDLTDINLWLVKPESIRLHSGRGYTTLYSNFDVLIFSYYCGIYGRLIGMVSKVVSKDEYTSNLKQMYGYNYDYNDEFYNGVVKNRYMLYKSQIRNMYFHNKQHRLVSSNEICEIHNLVGLVPQEN